MADPTLLTTDLATAQKLGLSPDEFAHICTLLGRVPNFTELSVYSVMWSEHCSYKNSILWLKKLPKEGSRVLAAAGEENAGLLRLGHGLAVAFKIESHNHPSAIEPYQGAATGVGGIHRDIFTLGARPIAALNSLRFGQPTSPHTQRLLQGVVKGIGDYGNAFGIPTVGGEIFFDEAYEANPLVNAMSVGIVPEGQHASATARGVGNPVYIVGSATGRDGIHGATFASEDLTHESASKLPSVQVGDPFAEKLLLEATLEALATGAVVGMQDMGAAGVACSTSEMSARGTVGMDIFLDRVPQRQPGMLPFEILLSESQERMLMVVQQGREADVEAVFRKWDLAYAAIGTVTEGNTLNYFWHGQQVGTLPADSLVLGGGAPQYERERREPAYRAELARFDPAHIPEPADLAQVLLTLVQRPNLCSRRVVRRRYDATVGAASITGNAFTDAAVVHVHGTPMALAMTTDCNPRYVWADPRRGTALAVAEAARNIACTGGIPLGVTNCLNFGNPHVPEVYWQFTEAIMGMKEACEAFGIPVTGGNVSFYNQTAHPDGRVVPVLPTPTIGMVGVIEDATRTLGMAFQQAGHQLLLLGHSRNDLGCSEYLVACHGITASPAPHLDLSEELRLQQALLHLIRQGHIASAHDVSDGGLLMNLFESLMAAPTPGLGIRIHTAPGLRKDAFLFGEAGGRAVVSLPPDHLKEVEAELNRLGQPYLFLGDVTADGHLTVNGQSLGSTAQLAPLYHHSLAHALHVPEE